MKIFLSVIVILLGVNLLVDVLDSNMVDYSMNMTQFTSALQSLPQFVQEMDADWQMVYDFMESQCGDLKDYHWEEVYDTFIDAIA